MSSLGTLATTDAGVVMAGLVETDLRPGATVGGGALVYTLGAMLGGLRPRHLAKGAS